MASTKHLVIRRAEPVDFEPWLALFEAVAAEGRWIGREPPLDPVERRERFDAVLASPDDVSFVALVDGELAGNLGANLRRGLVDFGILVGTDWRGRGIGSQLLQCCVEWAIEKGAHKIALEVWPHNGAAIALYEKFGFVIEGRRVRHYRRRNSELWDSIEMGLVLDTSSPGSPHDAAQGSDA
jgi:RimJ/RimL family protein N-acetyltransferase